MLADQIGGGRLQWNGAVLRGGGRDEEQDSDVEIIAVVPETMNDQLFDFGIDQGAFFD